MTRLRHETHVFLLAVQFLTRLPVPRSIPYTPARMQAAVRYYPLVGAVIGAIAAAVYWASTYAVTPLLAVLLSTAASLLLTGAFHEDGLADTFDGIGGGHTRVQMLEIMRDSRIGTYGTVALVMVLACKVAAVNALPVAMATVGLIAAHTLSRVSSVIVIATGTYVGGGTGKHTAHGISRAGLSVAVLTGVMGLAAIAWCISPLAALAAGAGLIAGHGLMRLYTQPRLGGYTGDTLGAVQQVSELGVYMGLVACL